MASFSLAAQTDVHAHIITDSYRSFIDSHKASLDEGFPLPEWSVSAHLAFMDKAGIQTSVLTVPAPQPYFGDAQESAIICRELNEECAAIKSAHPSRFRFCAVLPLPDVDAALAEGRYLDCIGWLKEHIHRYGALYDAGTMVKMASGEPFDARYYLDYLEDKYSRLYSLGD